MQSPFRATAVLSRLTELLACAAVLLFVQALADGDEQFGDARSVMRALALA